MAEELEYIGPPEGSDLTYVGPPSPTPSRTPPTFGFLDTLVREHNLGVEEMNRGLGMTLSPPSYLSALALEGPSRYLLGAIQAGPGALITAGGRFLGSLTQDATEYLGGSPNVQAGIATGVELLSPNLAGKVSQLGRMTRIGTVKVLPGSQAAQVESYIDKTRALLRGMLEKNTAEFEAKNVKLTGVSERIPLTDTLKTLNGLIAEAKSHGSTPGTQSFVGYAESLRDRIAKLDGAPDVRWVDFELSQAGKMTKALTTGGTDIHPGYSRIFASMASDLENPVPRTANFEPSRTKAIKETIFTTTPAEAPAKSHKAVYGPSGEPVVVSAPYKPNTATKIGEDKITPGAPGQVSWREVGYDFPGKPKPQPKTATTSQTEFTESGYSTQYTITPSGAGKLVREKDVAYRQKAAIEDASEIFEKMVKHKRGQEGAVDVNANQVLDRIDKNKYLYESLKLEDYKDLEAILIKTADLPMLPPPKGAMAGSAKVVGPVLAAGGLDYFAGTQGAITAATAVLEGFGMVSKSLLPTRMGRKALRWALESGPLDQQKLNTLAMVARYSSPEGLREFRNNMRSREVSPDEKTQAMIGQGEARQAIQQILQQVY